MILNERRKIGSSDENLLVDEKLSHLNSKDDVLFKKIIRHHPEVIANSFEYVRLST